MMYADSVTKKFLNYGVPWAGADPIVDSTMSLNQDPTYMGFHISITPYSNAKDNPNMDEFPHGLFTIDPVKDVYSTYNYLINRGEYKRAAYILEFETQFKKLVNDCPWFFVKVTGLADAWKIDPAESWRGKDKKLVIETLESIDMKMTYLMDLYRKAVFDYAWMRYAVPENMRYFKMAITVSEVRPMNINFAARKNEPIAAEKGKKSKLDKVKEAAKDKIKSVADSVVSALIGSFVDADGAAFGLRSADSAPWSTATFIRFSFEQCEFDFFSEAPPYLESVGHAPEAPASNKITIKTNVISERNVYGLLGAILEDTMLWGDYGKDSKEKVFYDPSLQSTIKEPMDANEIAHISTVTDYSAGMADRKKAEDRFQQQYGKEKKGPLAHLGNKLLKGATSYAKNAVMTAVNGFLLGNVYKMSPMKLLGSAQDMLANPAGAIEKIMSKHSSPGIGADLARKVELTGAEINLVKELIGMGNMQTAESTTAAEPEKVTFTEESSIKSPPGKTSFTAFAAAGASDKKVIFNESVTSQKSLGNIGLEGAPIEKLNLGKTDLS